MVTLYSFLTFMVLVAIGIICIPLLKNRSIKSFIVISVFLLMFSFMIYSISGNKAALKQWLTQGQKHYQLQNQVIDLGGIENIIATIQKKLKDNPNDAKGWLILGKLYLSQHNNEAAKVVLKKAHELDPDNSEIMQYFERVI